MLEDGLLMSSDLDEPELDELVRVVLVLVGLDWWRDLSSSLSFFSLLRDLPSLDDVTGSWRCALFLGIRVSRRVGGIAPKGIG